MAPRRASRLRRGVFGLLAGVRLAAGGGALILMGWSGAEMLRSPLSAPMIEGWWGSAGHFLPLVALMLFPVIQMQHFCSQHRGFIICIATITFVMASYLVLFANVRGIDQIPRRPGARGCHLSRVRGFCRNDDM